MPHLVTSHQAADHVSSANDAHYNAGTIGNGSYLLPVRSLMASTMVDPNTLRILAGDAVCCGYRWEIEGDYEEVNIENGVPGYNRIDLVVAHIETKPEEKIELRVIKGEETTGIPVVPGHIDGDLNDGDTVTEMPVCSVRIDGINPQEPVSLLKELTTLDALKAECDEHWDSLSRPVKIVTIDFAIGCKHGSNAKITAPSVEGYSFEGWVGVPGTSGWVGSLYYSSPKTEVTTVWVAYSPFSTGNGNAVASALYVPQ